MAALGLYAVALSVVDISNEAGPFANSLSPRPLQFAMHSSERPTWMDAYVIRHDIGWTGMPSFQTLSEADAWHLAWYVEGQSNPSR